jgi:hypothetical protein
VINRLVKRASSEAQRGGRNGGPKKIERLHRNLEAAPRRPKPSLLGDATSLEAQCRQRVRSDHLDALGNGEAGIIGEDDKRRNATGAWRFAGSGEQRVKVSDAAVGDPGFLAIDDIAVAIFARRAGHGCGVGTRVLLGQCESRYPLTRPRFRQNGRTQLS